MRISIIKTIQSNIIRSRISVHTIHTLANKQFMWSNNLFKEAAVSQGFQN